MSADMTDAPEVNATLWISASPPPGVSKLIQYTGLPCFTVRLEGVKVLPVSRTRYWTTLTVMLVVFELPPYESPILTV